MNSDPTRRFNGLYGQILNYAGTEGNLFYVCNPSGKAGIGMLLPITEILHIDCEKLVFTVGCIKFTYVGNQLERSVKLTQIDVQSEYVLQLWLSFVPPTDRFKLNFATSKSGDFELTIGYYNADELHYYYKFNSDVKLTKFEIIKFIADQDYYTALWIDAEASPIMQSCCQGGHTMVSHWNAGCTDGMMYLPYHGEQMIDGCLTTYKNGKCLGKTTINGDHKIVVESCAETDTCESHFKNDKLYYLQYRNQAGDVTRTVRYYRPVLMVTDDAEPKYYMFFDTKAISTFIDSNTTVLYVFIISCDVPIKSVYEKRVIDTKCPANSMRINRTEVYNYSAEKLASLHNKDHMRDRAVSLFKFNHVDVEEFAADEAKCVKNSE